MDSLYDGFVGVIVTQWDNQIKKIKHNTYNKQQQQKML